MSPNGRRASADACGPGEDVAHVDSKDQVAADCEKVKGAYAALHAAESIDYLARIAVGRDWV